jgi:hypothetical protein
MSSHECNSTASAPKSGGDGNALETELSFDPVRHIAPVVAHELNNILTIVQGYTDRLLSRHRDDPALVPHLRLISEASKRAAAVVRTATPQRTNEVFQPSQSSAPTVAT